MSRQIPKAKGKPLVGLLPEFIQDPFAYVKTIAAYGDMVDVSLGSMRFVYVFHPDFIEHILIKNRGNYPKGKLMKRTELIFGKGLVTAEGSAWKKQRKRMAASFSPKIIDAFADDIARITGEFLDGVNGNHNVGNDCMSLTLSIVLELLFGSDQSTHFDVIGNAFDELAHFFAASSEFFVQLPLWIPTPRNQRFKNAYEIMDKTVQRIIDERRQNTLHGSDLLSKILAESSNGELLQEDIIRDEVRTLMLAGHETTSLAIAFSLWFLSAEPERQEMLRAEINAVTGHGPVQGQHYSALSAIEKVVKEAIRILPPAPIFVRESIEDDQIGPYTVPAGTPLVLSPIRIQNDPRWFQAPECFNPERWSKDFKSSLHRFAYFPFGGGPRVCIGMRMAMLESVLVLAEYIRRFHITRNADSALDLQPSITLRIKSPLRLNFTPVS